MIALVVPVLYNMRGLASLIASVDRPVLPIVIPNWESNIGVSAAWNEGLRRAGDCEFTVISNDDIVLEPGCLDTMVESLSETTILTSITNTLPSDECRPDGDDVDFSCFAVETKRFTKTVGWFDENFTPAYFEDNDMHRRIALSGHDAVRLQGARAWHRGSVTQHFHQHNPVVTGPMFLENQTYYTQKWGGAVGQERYETPYNIPQLTYKHWIKNYKQDVVIPMMAEYGQEGFGYSQE